MLEELSLANAVVCTHDVEGVGVDVEGRDVTKFGAGTDSQEGVGVELVEDDVGVVDAEVDGAPEFGAGTDSYDELGFWVVGVFVVTVGVFEDEGVAFIGIEGLREDVEDGYLFVGALLLDLEGFGVGV